MKRPHVVLVFGDQWRGQACGYAGDSNVRTPHIDRLAGESVSFRNAISGCPVCTPYRASLLTGQRPLTHGLFLNDAPLGHTGTSIAEAFASGGYSTAYVGKWHVDGHGRDAYIPPGRRQGFEYWKVRECTHAYNDSMYYDNDDPTPVTWEGYDAASQTRDACEYIRRHADGDPFFLVVSWGPPHNPYQTAPREFRDMYDAASIRLRPNVPADRADSARNDLAGYYAHCSALDRCVGELLSTLSETGIADDTVFLFTSDHGDMLGSQGQNRKQRPYAESVRVPFLLRYSRRLGTSGREVDGFIDAQDIMPTLLGLCELPVPSSVEGRDFSAHAAGGEDPSGGRALVACYHPFGEFERRGGGREYRGIVTGEHTYVRTLDGPWLLFDDIRDPYQLVNLVGQQEHAGLQQRMDAELDDLLERESVSFLAGDEYLARWGYEVNERGTIPCPSTTG